MRVKQFSYVTFVDIGKVMELNGFNSDGEMSYFVEVVTLKLQMSLSYCKSRCVVIMWFGCYVKYESKPCAVPV